MNLPAKAPGAMPSASAIEAVLIRGDLSKLSEDQRNEYYLRLCGSLGLNPLTRPFDYLTLNGKLVLYVKRDGTDQLRKINSISVKILSRAVEGELMVVAAQARDREGREDEDVGVVPWKNQASEFSANILMKAVTKAKRRVTLSICGLGFLDESELSGLHERPALISKAQRKELMALANDVDADMPSLLDFLGERWEMDLARVADIPASHFEDAMQQLRRKQEALAAPADAQEDSDAAGTA